MASMCCVCAASAPAAALVACCGQCLRTPRSLCTDGLLVSCVIGQGRKICAPSLPGSRGVRKWAVHRSVLPELNSMLLHSHWRSPTIHNRRCRHLKIARKVASSVRSSGWETLWKVLYKPSQKQLGYISAQYPTAFTELHSSYQLHLAVLVVHRSLVHCSRRTPCVARTSLQPSNFPGGSHLSLCA